MDMAEHYDTVLTAPGRDGAAGLTVQLNLEVPEPDLSGVDALLDSEKLAALAEAFDVAEAPEPAVDHVRQALAHLAASNVRAAWPPLVIGVEGLFWAEALEDGYLDDDDRFTEKASRRGTSTNAIDIILALPMNERVQRFMRRRAFGGPANAFRHGRLHAVGEREQCVMWLLALVVWLDGARAWRPVFARLGGDCDDRSGPYHGLDGRRQR
jgi:hypothetical protein